MAKVTNLVEHNVIGRNSAERGLGGNREVRTIKQAADQMQNRLDRKDSIVLCGVPEEIYEGKNFKIRDQKYDHDRPTVTEACNEVGLNIYEGC